MTKDVDLILNMLPLNKLITFNSIKCDIIELEEQNVT